MSSQQPNEQGKLNILYTQFKLQANLGSASTEIAAQFRRTQTELQSLITVRYFSSSYALLLRLTLRRSLRTENHWTRTRIRGTYVRSPLCSLSHFRFDLTRLSIC